MAVAVRINGKLRDYPTDLSADSTFPIYSITKTLTAICALRLADDGLLRVDVPIQAWLPELELPATVTLAHLLRHTSGLRDYGPIPEYHQAVRRHPGRPWTRQQFLDAVLPNGLTSFVAEIIQRRRTGRSESRVTARVTSLALTGPSRSSIARLAINVCRRASSLRQLFCPDYRGARVNWQNAPTRFDRENAAEAKVREAVDDAEGGRRRCITDTASGAREFAQVSEV